jgi:hypothetical protein
MEIYQCYVCGQDMEKHHKIAYIDYTCNKNDDHHLSFRIVHNVMMGTKNLTKLRVAFPKDRLHLKIHYDQGCTEVWAKSNSSNRIKINSLVFPDFEDISKLKDKIKMLLVFS